MTEHEMERILDAALLRLGIRPDPPYDPFGSRPFYNPISGTHTFLPANYGLPPKGSYPSQTIISNADKAR